MTTDKHEVLMRMRAIELLAYWEGRLVTNRLVTWFGVSRQQASADIKRYLVNHNPGSMQHDPSVKGYVPVDGFTPVLSQGHINEYLDMVSGLASNTMAVTLETGAYLASVQLPDRSVSPKVVREVITACRLTSSVQINYTSMTSPEGVLRVISPHTLVYTGFRWHVRAYCHTKKDFRDFILSRIDGTPEVSLLVGEGIEQDRDWQHEITVTLVPNIKLTKAQQQLIAKDFGMERGWLKLTVRQALVHYTLQRYQAAITATEVDNELQYPLQLRGEDKGLIAQHLFDV
jgi:predicted DNA-binding transcriptional regulator YafY